ncbi:MAG: periplasmic heavy metal sensor [Fimbriimonadaceae bacterium]|nr:periplasmic heavy metal sensor [Fimbriimonadaceae bacterium]
MTRRKRWLWGLTTCGALGLLALLAGPRVALAQEAPRLLELLPDELADRPVLQVLRGSLPKLLRLKREMGMQPEQWTKIKAVLRQHDAELRTAGRAVAQRHQVVSAAVRQEPLDEPAVRRAVAEMNTAVADLAILRARLRAEIKPLLTPAQQQKLETFRTEVEAAVAQSFGVQ